MKIYVKSTQRINQLMDEPGSNLFEDITVTDVIYKLNDHFITIKLDKDLLKYDKSEKLIRTNEMNIPVKRMRRLLAQANINQERKTFFDNLNNLTGKKLDIIHRFITPETIIFNRRESKKYPSGKYQCFFTIVAISI